MIESIPVSQWILLALSGILFLGPGGLLLTFYEGMKQYDLWEWGILSFCLSGSILPVFFAWLHPTGLALNRWFLLLLFLISWFLMVWRLFRRKDLRIEFSKQNVRFSLALGFCALIVIGVGLYGIRHTVAGLGSDSYHHTLITQLIVENGRIPDNLLSVSPIASFTYHFGFHAISAFFSWMTGIEPRLIIPLLGRIFIALSGLATAFFVRQATGRRIGALVSFFITAVVAVFPGYMLNWGRYTQLFGLILLAVFLAAMWNWTERDHSLTCAPMLSLLGAGLVFAHYRITIMSFVAVGILFIVKMIERKPQRGIVLRAIKNGFWVVGGISLLTLVWGIHLVLTFIQGNYAITNELGSNYYSFSRLGDPVLQYATNYFVFGLALLSIVIGLLRRNVMVVWLFLWSILILFLSRPPFAGFFMDFISVSITVFIPLSLFIGYGVSAVLSEGNRIRLAGILVSILGVLIIAWSFSIQVSAVSLGEGEYVSLADLEAAQWAKQNIEKESLFMVNMFHFDFEPKYIIGSDGGYWLPALSGHKTVTMPMIYIKEVLISPDWLDDLIKLDKLSGDLTSPISLQLLHSVGIDYVYVGHQPGTISSTSLLYSSNFELVYDRMGVQIFQLVDPLTLSK